VQYAAGEEWNCFTELTMAPAIIGAITFGSTIDKCQIPISFAMSAPGGNASKAIAQSTAIKIPYPIPTKAAMMKEAVNDG